MGFTLAFGYLHIYLRNILVVVEVYQGSIQQIVDAHNNQKLQPIWNIMLFVYDFYERCFYSSVICFVLLLDFWFAFYFCVLFNVSLIAHLVNNFLNAI